MPASPTHTATVSPAATLSPAASPTSAASPSRRELVAILALTTLALLLRVTSLSRSLFTDEVYSFALAQRSFGHMVALFGYEANGTPYSIVLWPLIRVFGTGAALLRAPAVLAGTASVPALWWAARRFAPAPGALLAAALLAVNPMAVWYSQAARSYAFVVLAACIAFGALPRALEPAARRRFWVVYVGAMAVLAYSEIFAAPLVLPAQALIAKRAGAAGLRRWLRSLLALLACCVPLLVAAAISRSRRDALYWLPKPDRALFTLALQEFTGGFSESTAVRWATLAAGAALVGAGAWRLYGRHRSTARTQDAAATAQHAATNAATAERSAFAVALCWALVPGAALFAISFAEPVFWPRYAIVALPGLCLLVALAAAAVWSIRRGVALAVACAAIACATALAADARQRDHLQENWLPIAAWLKAERTAGEPTIVDNALVLPSLGYYDPAFRAGGGELIVQEWRDLPLPRGFVGYKDRTGYGSVPNGPPSAAAFERLARVGHGRAWLIVAEVDDVLQSNPRDGVAVAWARSHCRVQVRESIGVWALHATACRG